jgi:hypothetical protein
MPYVLDKAFRRFCCDHWQDLIEVNPKLKSFDAPNPKDPLPEDVQLTMFDSNLMGPDPRLLLFGEEKWLTKIISNISKKDVGDMFVFAQPDPIVAEETVASQPPSTIPDNSTDAKVAIAVPVDQATVGSTALVDREPIHKFSLTARKAYWTIVCEEIRAIDPLLPIVGEAEDCLGLCLLDMQRPDLALPHFQASVSVRESFPELQDKTLQTQLFIANCLFRLEKKTEARHILAKVRSEIVAPSPALDANAIVHLNRYADAIEAENNSNER